MNQKSSYQFKTNSTLANTFLKMLRQEKFVATSQKKNNTSTITNCKIHISDRNVVSKIKVYSQGFNRDIVILIVNWRKDTIL